MPDNAEEYMMRVLHVISEIAQLSLSDLGSKKHISCTLGRLGPYFDADAD